MRHLGGVTVRAYILPQHIAITPMQYLKGEALTNLNNLSVADAMRFFSGVQLKDYGGIGGVKTLDVRSMGTNHLGVFYDGIAVGNPQNGIVDLGKFSLDNMEEVSLYNGYKAELLQPARSLSSAAALYLKTRRPVFDKNERTNIKASFKTGSFGLVNPSVLVEQRVDKRLSASLSGEFIHADGRYRFRYTNGMYDTSATRHNADIRSFRIEPGLFGLLRDSSQWQVKVYFYDAEKGLPGAIVANKFQHPQRQWDRNFFVQGNYRSRFKNDRYRLLLNTKYANDYTRYVDPEYNNLQGYLDNHYTQREYYVSLAQEYKITKWWQASVATDLQYNTLDANLYRFPYPARITSLAALSSSVHLSRLDIQASLLGTFINEKVKEFEGAEDAREWMPSVAFTWQPLQKNADLRIRGFYKSIFRMPTFNDLYYTFIGNANLQPEYAKQYDIGVSWMDINPGALQYLSVQADVYYNRVTNKIVAIPTTNLFRWMMINLGQVEIKGLDINLQSLWKLNQFQITAGIKYTFQQAEDITTGVFNYGQQIPYIPQHSGSVIAGAGYNTWNLQYSFIYTGERYSQKANIPVNYVQPWYTHDLSVSKNFMWQQKQVKISMAVNNLLDQYYDVVINYPMPGRNVRLGVQLSL
ncbi:MAG: TonB-dependent receptor [Chitinophagaceae bacterium]